MQVDKPNKSELDLPKPPTELPASQELRELLEQRTDASSTQRIREALDKVRAL